MNDVNLHVSKFALEVLVMGLGFLCYLSGRPKVHELGKIMFSAGLLALLLSP